MCGFFVAQRWQAGSENILKECLESISHRGPDDAGWALVGEDGKIRHDLRDLPENNVVVLGHRRLSIIDTTPAGHQPMVSEDEQHLLVFNGEIYNYLELKAELINEGVAVYADSDSKVLLLALMHWGMEAISKLRGMFAFVYVDRVENKLVACRDFFGIKPLFFIETREGNRFGSEIQSLVGSLSAGVSLNSARFYDYLLTGSTDFSEQTLVSQVKQVLPGHYHVYDLESGKRESQVRYWRLDSNKIKTDTFDKAKTKVRKLFLDSVELHLRSDVPVGAALSGGIDSSSIVCAMRYISPSLELNTFSYIAEDERLSEERWVDVVNDHIGAIPHKVTADSQQVINDLPDLIQAQCEPFGSTSIYAQYRVFKAASDAGIKVMLDGQGADEMLGGYVGYQGSRLAGLMASYRLWSFFSYLNASRSRPDRSVKLLLKLMLAELLPPKFKWTIKEKLTEAAPPAWINRSWLAEHGVELTPTLENYYWGANCLKERLADTLLRTSVPKLLRYEDRNSMNFSIESRVPFLHVELVEYLFSLPDSYLISPEGLSKYVFREAMRGIVPDSILDRSDKIGFATPELDWLRLGDGWVRNVLRKADKIDGLVQAELVSEWERFMLGQTRFDSKFWRWINAIEWYDHLLSS